MHGTILNIGEKTNETYLFERMVVEWPGIDYVDRNEDCILEPLLDFLRSRGVPLTENRCLVVTEESKKKLDSERKAKIKELAEKICDQDQSDGWPEYYLKNVLDDDPYDVYVAFDDDVMTLNLFLRTWEPGEYFITETFDYHS